MMHFLLVLLGFSWNSLAQGGHERDGTDVDHRHFSSYVRIEDQVTQGKLIQFYYQHLNASLNGIPTTSLQSIVLSSTESHDFAELIPRVHFQFVGTPDKPVNCLYKDKPVLGWAEVINGVPTVCISRSIASARDYEDTRYFAAIVHEVTHLLMPEIKHDESQPQDDPLYEFENYVGDTDADFLETYLRGQDRDLCNSFRVPVITYPTDTNKLDFILRTKDDKKMEGTYIVSARSDYLTREVRVRQPWFTDVTTTRKTLGVGQLFEENCFAFPDSYLQADKMPGRDEIWYSTTPIGAIIAVLTEIAFDWMDLNLEACVAYNFEPNDRAVCVDVTGDSPVFRLVNGEAPE